MQEVVVPRKKKGKRSLIIVCGSLPKKVYGNPQT